MKKLGSKNVLLNLLLVVVLSACSIQSKERIPEFNHLLATSTTQGYDVLGLAKYCDTYLSAPNLPAVSTLLNTFGDPLPCLRRKLDTGSLSLVQVDLMDATCWRNRVCPPGTPALTDWRVMKARAE